MFRYLFFAFFILLYSCQSKIDQTEMLIHSQIDEIKKIYVKDGRTALFKVDVVKTSDNKYKLVGETIFPEAKQQLIDNRLYSVESLIDSITILPASHLNEKIYGIVNLSVCNIRSKPKHSAELATQSILGTPVRVYKKEGDFYFIQTPDNYLGWVDDGGIHLMEENEYNNWMNSERAVCIKDYSFVYDENKISSDKVTDLMAGNIFQLIKTGKSFSEIKLPDGRTGFVKSEEIMHYEKWIKSREPSSGNIIASAKEMIGRPYLWGGTSGKGMDCSGFTKTAFYLNGIQLERDASLQVHTGEVIETDTTLKNLIPGDLLFFGKYRDDGSQRITHVAIYLGDGKMIHASDRVQIQSLKRGDPDFVEYRLKSFMQARRIIGSEGKNGIIALKDSPFY